MTIHPRPSSGPPDIFTRDPTIAHQKLAYATHQGNILSLGQNKFYNLDKYLCSSRDPALPHQRLANAPPEIRINHIWECWCSQVHSDDIKKVCYFRQKFFMLERASIDPSNFVSFHSVQHASKTSAEKKGVFINSTRNFPFLGHDML